MIPGIENIARTLTTGSLNKQQNRILPCAFSMRAKDEGYLSVREIKEGWQEYVQNAYAEYQEQYKIDNPGKEMPPMVGYAEINVEALENTIIEDEVETDQNTSNAISFLVEEIPPDNTEFHAGIKFFSNNKQIVVSNTEPLPDGAIIVDKVPDMRTKRKLIELSKYVPFD